MPSLSRAAAHERAASIDVDAYDVDLDLTQGDERFGSVTTIEFKTTSPGLSTFVDIRPHTLRSATLNGIPIDVRTWRDGRLPLPDLALRNVLAVEAEMSYTNTGQGLHRFIDPIDGRTYLYAANFLDQAPTVFACFDQPDLKAPFTVHVTANPSWTVAGNGAATSVEPGRWELAATPPLATYFVTLIAGPYHAVHDEHDGIPLAIFARASLRAALDQQAAELFALTRACIDRYHELFRVRYPFGHYQQAFVPEFTMGAMENPGCVTFRDEYIFTSAVTDADREQRALVIAHEMAHMWFGDLVTMAWWDDLWLNESFAEYLGHRVTAEVTEFTNAWTTFALGTKAWGYAADQRPSTHPISADVVDTDEALLNFDGISYAKGAAVLRQLVALLGDDAFFAGLRAHFDAHAYGNASLADLLMVLSEASGRDLTEWAHAWLRTVGVSTLRLTTAYDDTGTYADVRLTQESPHGLRPHRLRLGAYVESGGVTTRRKVVDVDIDPHRDNGSVDVGALCGQPISDLLLPNDEDLTYAKIRLAPADLKRLASVLPTVRDSLARALLWGSAWDLTRDAERAADWFVNLCRVALPVESDVAIFAEVVGYARDYAIARYLPPEATAAARRTLFMASRSSFDRADRADRADRDDRADCDGRDDRADRADRADRDRGRRLAAARAMITFAGPDDVEWLRDWLEPGGVTRPDDVLLDAELRWLIVGQLATLGASSGADIDAEFDRDRTAIAAEHRATAHAARPDPAAKAAAWTTLINDDTRSNRLLFAVARGFWQPDQGDLLAAYVDRYVADVPAMAARRTAQVAERIATLAFPSYAIDVGSLAAMTRMRDDESLVPALRRALIDETDELARSVAARDLAAQLQRARDDERTHG